MMVQLIINDKEIEAPESSTILEVARKHGIDIPTLCYHEALEPYGVCRLCIVQGGGWIRTRRGCLRWFLWGHLCSLWIISTKHGHICR